MDPVNELVAGDLRVLAVCRSEGFPLTGYFVPGRDEIGVWPNSKIAPGVAVCD